MICGPVEGSAGTTIADAIAHGDLPGIAYVIADGEIVVSGRSRQTPPPKRKLFFSCCDAHRRNVRCVVVKVVKTAASSQSSPQCGFSSDIELVQCAGRRAMAQIRIPCCRIAEQV